MELGTRPFVAFAAALLAGPLAGDLAAGGCQGCVGITNHAGSALASCATSPLMDWQIAVAFEIESGTCASIPSSTTITCDPEPCSGTVTYSWGSSVAGGLKDVGYHQARPSQEPATTWYFPDGPPWKEGEPGSLSFGPDADPTLDCGRVYSYFITADVCGPIEASVWASCTACGLAIGS